LGVPVVLFSFSSEIEGGPIQKRTTGLLLGGPGDGEGHHVQVLDLQQLWLGRQAGIGHRIAWPSMQITATIVEDQEPSRDGPPCRPGHPKEAQLQCGRFWTGSPSTFEIFEGLLPPKIFDGGGIPTGNARYSKTGWKGCSHS